MSQYPFLCLICSCPLQPLSDKQGNPVGDITDAVARHNAVVHPEEMADGG